MPGRLTPSERALRARLAAHIKHAACEDPSAATAPARRAFLDRFMREARERFGDLPDEELARRAEHLKRAYFTKLSLRSSTARRKAREATDQADAADAELTQLQASGDDPDDREAA